MNSVELNELKINALALRNIASKVLEQVEREEKKNLALPSSTKKAKRISAEADMIQRIHTNRRKPLNAYK